MMIVARTSIPVARETFELGSSEYMKRIDLTPTG
jgi:hypothetical protein